MRKIIVLVLIAAAYYIASMYRQLPLMVLSLAEMVLVLLLFLLTRILKKGTVLTFGRQDTEMQKGVKGKCCIHVENKSRFPLRRLCIWIEMYDDRGEVLEKQKVRADMKKGPEMPEFEVCPPRLGLLRIRMRKAYIYDYLGIFKAKVLPGQDMDLMVLPGEKQICLELLPENRAQEYLPREQNLYFQGNESREILWIREYRNEDSMRHIHWNQSARMDGLWVKEYEKERDTYLDLLLDLRLPGELKEKEKDILDSFYEVTGALTLGFLQKGWRMRVCWYDGKAGGFDTVPVEDRTQYRTMMFKLYGAGIMENNERAERIYEERRIAAGEGLLELNLDLECYYLERGNGEGCCTKVLRHKFDHENLEQQDNSASLR